jgi:hypothetical protein
MRKLIPLWRERTNRKTQQVSKISALYPATLMVSPSDKNKTNTHPSASQNTVSMFLRAQGIVFGCLLGSVMWCHSEARQFYFQIRVKKTDFITCHIAVKKATDFDSIRFHQRRGNTCVFFAEFRVPPLGNEERSGYKISIISKFPQSPGHTGALFQFLLTFPWLSRVVSLWWAHQFFVCFLR